MDLVAPENHVRWQLQMRFPRLQADFALHQRLVNGILHRRKRILYHSSHQRKLQHGLEDALPSFDAYAEHPTENSAMALESDELEQSTVPANRGPAKMAVTFIESTASTVKKVPRSACERSVIFPGVTMSQTGRRQALDIPQIPRPSTFSTQEIVCPYCSHLITNDLGKEYKLRTSRWR